MAGVVVVTGACHGKGPALQKRYEMTRSFLKGVCAGTSDALTLCIAIGLVAAMVVAGLVMVA